jgi:hypothetical protein
LTAILTVVKSYLSDIAFNHPDRGVNNMKQTTHLVPQGQPTWTLERFGINDNKGRMIGAYYTIGQCEFVNYDSEQHRGYGSYHKEAGKYFFTCVHAARDTDQYGGCQASKYFKTMAEAQNEIAKYLANAKKRAIKNFGAK